MKHFNCPQCTKTVYFENTTCINCGTSIGYNPKTDAFEIAELETELEAQPLRYCNNYNYGVCNWLVQNHHDEKFCKACELNRTVPNGENANLERWQKLEVAKHRLVYQLLKLGLPVTSKLKNTNGIAFDFLTEDNPENAVTGHANGVVTIILLEADSVHRELMRTKMNEPYRTLLGHFRHEIGHYYWQLLFDENNLANFRDVFGDERVDYGEALNLHYNHGAPNDWQSNYISAYASSHPWEDWAESWAHYLHIMDTLETASSLGISILNSGFDSKSPIQNPYETQNFSDIYKSSVNLTIAVNNLNRSMGIMDIYPFTIPQPVFIKLNFIHDMLKNKYCDTIN